MPKIKITPENCPQNHKCPLLDVCPVGAISQDGFSAPKIDDEKCIACGQCVVSCAYETLSFE